MGMSALRQPWPALVCPAALIFPEVPGLDQAVSSPCLRSRKPPDSTWLWKPSERNWALQPERQVIAGIKIGKMLKKLLFLHIF